MPAQSETDEKDVQQESATLTRRELREQQKAAEEAERNSALVAGPPDVRPVPVKSDSWLPPLFEEEVKAKTVKEEPVVVAAEYAREAPEGKHLGSDQPQRIIIPPAPKPVAAVNTGVRHPGVRPVPVAAEPTSSGTVMKIVGLSVLYYSLPFVAGAAIFMTSLPTMTAP